MLPSVSHRAGRFAGITLGAVLLTSSLSAQELQLGRTHMPASPNLQHAAVVFIVDAVEPCVSFWVDRFGFTTENQVPGPDGKLVFASVKSGGIEVMYQTKASVLAENPAAAKDLEGHTGGLFITVGELDAAERAARGSPVVKSRHKTFYGSEEFYVKDPGGNTIGFAQFR
jgi:uncharacterized glyoxalase superfamily protein PhnB